MVREEICVDLSAHGSDDQLEQYALGRLPATEITPLEEHLLACDNCRAKVDAFEHVSIGMREVLVEDAMKPEGGFAAWLGATLRRPAVSMALAFALLIAVAGVFSQGKTKFAPMATLQLTAIRGEMPATVPTRELDVTLADGPRTGGAFRVDVLDAAGGSVWRGLAESGASGVRVDVKQRLGPGDYFLRLYDASGAVMREYGFRIRN
jgi:anti-sigma factor RsiW